MVTSSCMFGLGMPFPTKSRRNLTFNNPRLKLFNPGEVKEILMQREIKWIRILGQQGTYCRLDKSLSSML